MLEARTSLGTISTFFHDAQAYMKGQLQCSPVQEAVLWERLAETKASVVTALADDFDTPRAINAVMNLVYHGNCQLQPVSKVQEADVMSSSGSLEAVVEQLTNFRSEVRAFALARSKTSGLYPERIPLLKACDNLRNDLAPLGVLIKDRGATSTWEITQGQRGQKVQDKDPETSS
eukprot:superscaffoldBa00004033_g18144